MNLYTMILEDGKEYYIIDTIVNNDDKYLIFANDETKDFAVRKVVNNNNKECITKLDSNEEYELVIALFNKKCKDGKNE